MDTSRKWESDWNVFNKVERYISIWRNEKVEVVLHEKRKKKKWLNFGTMNNVGWQPK